MKIFVKLMALILVLALIGPFFIKGPNGKPLMQIPNITRKFQSITSDLKNKINQAGDSTVGSSSHDKTTRVYRWQDATGEWHYASKPPEDVFAEAVEVDPNVVKFKSAPDQRFDSKTVFGSHASDVPISVPSHYRDVKDKVEQTKSIVESRNQQVTEQIDEHQ